MARASALFTDAFTDTNNLDLASHGSGWVQLNSFDGTVIIQAAGTQAGRNGYGSGFVSTPAARYTGSETSTLNADHWVSAVVNNLDALSTNYHGGVIVRATGDVDSGTNNTRDFYCALVCATNTSGSAQAVYFGKVINGTWTSWGNGTSVFTNGSDRIEIEDVGDVLQVMKNGAALTASTGSFTKDVSGDGDKLATSGKPGIVGGHVLLDDFQFGNFATGGSQNLSGSAITGGYGTQSPVFSIGL